MLHLSSLKLNAIVKIAALSVLCGCMAQATIIPGSIVATFSDPVFAGTLANTPVAGETQFADNTATAVYSIRNASSSSSLSWGTNAPATYQTFSELTFTGSTIPASVTTPFQVGSIVFTNGTSTIGSLIFGATLSFYDNSVSPSTFLGSDTVTITTTTNVFGVPGGLTSGDDDYINICGNNSSICSTSIEAVESSEGGTGVTVNLFGTIAGDPSLTLTSVALAPGQSGSTNGFLGADPPIGAETPEPATWTFLGGALALGFFIRRR